MKKTHIILLIYILIGVILLGVLNAVYPINFFGYCQTLDMARFASDEYPDHATAICTVEKPDRFLDFVISEDGQLYILTFDRRNFIGGERYKCEQWSRSDLRLKIKQMQASYDKNGVPEWENSRILLGEYEPVYWTILESSFEMQENAKAFPLVFNETEYTLYIKSE